MKVKKVFFNSSTANYDACLAGGLQLIPTGESLTELKRDYSAMQAANMILGEVPDFEDIIDRLGVLADSINKAM